ncbi:zinc ABC transporter substrate-binding protein [Thioclava sp. 15-R06ZXC-3]|uniref:High-affinity zinc uptake system protein ZnuA n=1 Tax=Thioclava arctica TaxID=3238301 RepID=A0ABV3TG49_9RHOB
MRFIIPLSIAAFGTFASLAQAEVPKVVTDIPPVQSLVAQVMGNLGTPSVLLGQNSDAHHYQLKPSQAGALQDAGLIVWIGPRLTPWLERALNGINAQDHALTLLGAPGSHTRQFSAADPHDHSADLDEDEDHDAHDTHATEATQTDANTDPHAWLDPDNAKVWLGLIAQDLGKLDPEHAQTYAANAKAAQERISAMDTRIKAQFAPVQDKAFLVYHAAYGYLADHYELNVAGALSPSDATAPGAAHMISLRKEATATVPAAKIYCAFPEAQHDPKMVDILVDGTPVKLGGALDPSGSSLTYGPGLYEALMQKTADTITTCLSSQD